MHTRTHTHTHTHRWEGEGRSKRTLWFLVRVTMWVLCSITQSSPTLFGPMDCSLPGSSVLGGSPGKNTGVGCPVAPPSGDLPNPGIETRSPALQADSLPTELSGKPRETPYIHNCYQAHTHTLVIVSDLYRRVTFSKNADLGIQQRIFCFWLIISY